MIYAGCAERCRDQRARPTNSGRCCHFGVAEPGIGRRRRTAGEAEPTDDFARYEQERKNRSMTAAHADEHDRGRPSSRADQRRRLDRRHHLRHGKLRIACCRAAPIARRSKLRAASRPKQKLPRSLAGRFEKLIERQFGTCAPRLPAPRLVSRPSAAPRRLRSGSAMTGVPLSAIGFSVRRIHGAGRRSWPERGRGAVPAEWLRLGGRAPAGLGSLPAIGAGGLACVGRGTVVPGARHAVRADDRENLGDHPRMQPRRLVDVDMVDARIRAHIDIDQRAFEVAPLRI